MTNTIEAGEAKPIIGIIGLGQMGAPMARHILTGGYSVVGFDINQASLDSLRSAGGQPAAHAADVVRRADIVLTSLVSPIYTKIAEETLLPNARDGQIFIDTSTVPGPETRRISAVLESKGARALDAPVTGGSGGAENASLTIFVGGEEGAFRRCEPLLRLLGQNIIYGGGIGQGQALKSVQQMKNRVTDAVRLEILAFGIRAGLDLPLVLQALGVDPDDRGDAWASLAQTIAAGRADELGCLITEWPYYLEEARDRGFAMPALEALYRHCKAGRPVFMDTQSRKGPSIWNELMRDAPADSGKLKL